MLLEELLNRIEAHNSIYMSDKRKLHVDSVTKDILEYIPLYKLNKDDAILVAKGHDISKELPEEIRIKMKNKWGLRDHGHEAVSAGMLKHIFGVSNKRVLDAIADHSLCSNGDILSKVFFVVDCVDDSKREWDDPELRQRVKREAKAGNIDLAVKLIKDEQARFYKQASLEAFELIFG